MWNSNCTLFTPPRQKVTINQHRWYGRDLLKVSEDRVAYFNTKFCKTEDCASDSVFLRASRLAGVLYRLYRKVNKILSAVARSIFKLQK